MAVTPKTFRDVYYWSSYEAAREWAARNGWPTNRIICYGRGWAVQVAPSGSYAGPGDEKTPRLAGGNSSNWPRCSECGEAAHPERIRERNLMPVCLDCAERVG